MDFFDGVFPVVSDPFPASPMSMGMGAGRFLDLGLKTIGLFPGLQDKSCCLSLSTILCFAGVSRPFRNNKIWPRLSRRIFIMSGRLTGSLRLLSFLEK